MKTMFLFVFSFFIPVLSLWAASPIRMVPVGSVEVRLGPQGAWQSVTAPTELAPGQEVRTGAGSSAEIAFSDGSKVRLAAHTSFNLDKTETSESVFTLAKGKIQAAFSGLFSSRISLRTPRAVCAVRGTVFELAADEKDTQVSMAEGLLEVKDSKGNNAVVSSEEMVKVGEDGLQAPQLISLSDNRALDAVRPMVVRQELARDQTRAMMEELRNRELKANEAQLGKDVIDAFGRRVRLEEYLLRPNSREFKLVFLSFRENRLDWGHLIERFKNPIPDDMTQVAGIVSGSFLSPTLPKNWIKYLEVFLTNQIDSVKETVAFGDPTLVNFSGYGAAIGSRYYPSSMDYIQTLSGPGVPGGSRVQFRLTQDYNATVAGMFTWRQQVIRDTGALDTLVHLALDPSNAADVAAGYTAIFADDKFGDPTIDPTTTVSFPRGRDKADFLVKTDYRDGSFVSSEKILVGNDGKVFDFSNPDSDTFNKEGNYNLELVVKSNLFQGRDIDVLIAPEILSHSKGGKTAPDVLKP